MQGRTRSQTTQPYSRHCSLRCEHDQPHCDKKLTKMTRKTPMMNAFTGFLVSMGAYVLPTNFSSRPLSPRTGSFNKGHNGKKRPQPKATREPSKGLGIGCSHDRRTGVYRFFFFSGCNAAELEYFAPKHISWRKMVHEHRKQRQSMLSQV